MECLDANTVQDLMAGALESGSRSAVLMHLDTCEDCRELLSVMGRETAKLSQRVDVLGETHASGPIADKADGLAETMAPTDAFVPVPRLPNRPAAGAEIGRYALIEKLGAGAMGVVWRATDPKLGREVALKLLRLPDASLIERLVREARSMAQVSHPNVVTVFEVGEAGSQSFIAMELVEGKSLRAWQTGERRTVPEIIEHYVAAGRGLAAAHARGIIHRDFKPDNVLVGRDGRVRVTDFGLAAAKPGESGSLAIRPIADVNLTTSGSVLGTPAYMAPEQFTGGNVDPRTDQFNFCVALYEALYGERPFEGKTFEELGTSVSDGKIKLPPAGTAVSGALRDLVVRGLSVAPGDRYPNMDALIVELGRDRARPWRRTAIGALVVGAVLAVALGADLEIRQRGSLQIRQSFELTGNAIAAATDDLRENTARVQNAANQAPALLEVAGHRDQADFGLGSPDADRQDLERLHNSLAQVKWVKLGNDVAFGDYKGRLLYASAAPTVWNTDLQILPSVKHALDVGAGDFMFMQPYGSRDLVTSGMVGAARPGLVIVSQHTISFGESAGSEARVLFFDLLDGQQLLKHLDLDRQTQLALVAPDGTSIGSLPTTLLDAAHREISEVAYAGDEYQVQQRDVPGLEGQPPIGRVVMARKIGGVLSLFPGSRIVFAVATLLSLVLAAFAAWQARRIAS
jgi:predicted Ser/Thr protein kinase